MTKETALVLTLFGALFTLKKTHYIDWSWWWITAPLWGSLLLALILIAAGIPKLRRKK
jgi:hypothetical protein